MTPTQASRRVLVERMSIVQRYLRQLRSLPLQDEAQFFGDSRNAWAAESCLRRMLEALFDLGRHILAKVYGIGAATYKDVALELGNAGVLSAEETKIAVSMAGYRNRLTHVYDEVTEDELFQVCTNNLGDVELILDSVRQWVQDNPDKIDRPLKDSM
jgi:uncharacterized protein YutE (UPF0331/DUF86 family)